MQQVILFSFKLFKGIIFQQFEINTPHKECVLPVMGMGLGEGIEC